MNRWREPDGDLTEFLTQFERGDSLTDEENGELFAEIFLAADPVHVVAVPRTAFVGSLPARREMFAAAGAGSAQLLSAHQLELDAHHSLLKTSWRTPRADQEDLQLESTFLVRRERDAVQILVYLNHQDVSKLLATRTPSPAE